MQLVERHLIKKDDPGFAVIDAAAFASKNLYNQANYQIRQAFLHQGKYLPYAQVFHLVKGMDCDKALPAKVANAILILLHKNWVAFFEALEAYKADPSRFGGRPRLPKYKDKEKGRNILISDKQALGKRLFQQRGKLVPSGLPIEIDTCVPQWGQLAQVRIVPRLDGYMMEVVYDQQEEQADVDPKLVAALDPGVNVLAALTSNKPGFVPRLVSGKPIKSLNQNYNKQRARLQSQLSHLNRFTCRQLDQLTTMGKRNNQQFVQIPHARFIDQLVYQAKLVGITVILQDESYTSKASFLDDDPIPTYRADQTAYPVFSGKRIARSWYRAAEGTIIHADINGSYNILRKSSSDPLQLGRGVGGAAVLPRRLAV